MPSAFNWLDYTIVISYVLGILAFGLWFVREQNSLTDFFMASRKMPWLAVGCSILATFLSAVSLVGVPAEFWQNGLQSSWSILCALLTAPIVIVLFVRLYCRIKIVTAYEYLEKRFSLPVRLLASFFFMLLRGCYMGIVLVASATLLFPIFNGNIHMVWLIIIMGLCAGLLAITGGMKAVIWTDVVQMIVIYGGLFWMSVSMIGDTGEGLAGVMQVCVEHNKDLSFFSNAQYWSWSPFVQTTFWGLLIGESVYQLASNGTDQMAVQRYLSTASEKEAAKSIWAYVLLTLPAAGLLWLTGAALFTFYTLNPDLLPQGFTCDQADSLLPHYLVTQVPHGLKGVMVAAIISAVLSTVDSGLNCLATASLCDFHLRLFPRQQSDAHLVRLARIWTIIWIGLSVLLAIIILYGTQENIVRKVSSVLGMFSGVLLGIFLLGILLRRSNTPGVMAGAIAGLIIVCWANYGWHTTGPDGQIIGLAPWWPAIISMVSTIVIGYLVSLFFKAPDEKKLTGLTYSRYT
jgi:SSS family transporter